MRQIRQLDPVRARSERIRALEANLLELIHSSLQTVATAYLICEELGGQAPSKGAKKAGARSGKRAAKAASVRRARG